MQALTNLDHTVGGPDRPPSKREIEQMRHEKQEHRQAQREGRGPPPVDPNNQEGYWSYMSRQVQERTERLGLVGDSMDRLEENSSNFANDVGKYVQSQKRKAVFGGKWLLIGPAEGRSFPFFLLAPCILGSMELTVFCSAGLEVWILGFRLCRLCCVV